MRSPAVSVCMPMRNASRHLRECIDSVLSQTFTDFEFLIADDGSTDCSIEIVESYSDPRIRLIKREHDFIASLNCLLDSAKGEYIARMDADDIMLPHRLKVQYEYMIAHPQVDIIGGEVFQLSESLKTTSTIETVNELYLFDFAHKNAINQSTAFIRTRTIKNIGLRYDSAFRSSADYKFFVDALSKGLIIKKANDAVIAIRYDSAQFDSEASSNTTAVKQYCQDILAERANASYIEPTITETSNQLTVIIPFLNEGYEISNTINSVRSYWGDRVDILVVNDHSYDGIDYQTLLSPYVVYYFYNSTRLGVASCRDFAISKIRTPFFLLLDGHMRLYDNTSLDLIVSLLSNNDRCVLCAQSIPLIQDCVGGGLILLENYDRGYGAYIPLSKGTLLPDIRWCDKEHDTTKTIEEIPTILGAGYAASVRYWQYLKGLTGLKGYGFDEAYISEKVWREGGRCLLLKDFITGHLYRKKSPYETFSTEMAYNSMFICSTLFPKDILHWAMAYAMEKNFYAYCQAQASITQDTAKIEFIKSYYDDILSIPFETIRHQHIKEIHAEASKHLKIVNLSTEFKEEFLAAINQTQSIDLFDGLGSALLYLIECEPTKSDLINLTIFRLLDICKNMLGNNALGIGFSGLSGIGWLLSMFCHKLPNHEYTCEVQHAIDLIDSYISSQLDSIDGFDGKSFENGPGGVFCYVIHKIQNYNITPQHSALLNQGILLKLYALGKSIIATSGYDMRSYFMVLQYLSLIEDVECCSNWKISITDCVTLPSINPEHGHRFLSLKNGIIGYALLSHLILCHYEKN